MLLTMAEIMHRHHIVPLHMGGQQDGPTILLTIGQHAEAHRQLWEEHGKWQDLVAWQCLSGAMCHQDAIKIAISEGGKIAAKLHRGMKRSQESRQRMSESAKCKAGGMERLRDPEMRKLVGLKNRGLKRSAETREKIRLGAVERYKRARENGGDIRGAHSLKSRERIGLALKNRPRDKLKICCVCSREFMTKREIASLCSAACRQRAHRLRSKQNFRI